jgi:hypothetical protein
MTVTLQLANQVRRLGRQDMTAGEIAVRLGLPESAIVDTLCMLGLPLPGGVIERCPAPPADRRAALREKMPKRFQDRIDKGKS